MKIVPPPIKSQGIKTKLTPWIKTLAPKKYKGLWVEPFMGTGSVAFNIAPKNSLLCDINPHLINFYQAISNDEVTPEKVRSYLKFEGERLLDKGEKHYYYIRERFNKEHKPLDFLFLNRSGFNGMIRFNRSGNLNIPFCKKPKRFSQSYITKIVNQVAYVSALLKVKKFEFKCQSFEETILSAKKEDVIYCDPPYIDRHVDYYNGWSEQNEFALHKLLSKTKGKFILSTWHHNNYRINKYINSLWSDFNILTKKHFYHVGANEKNRNPMVEAMVLNYHTPHVTKNMSSRKSPKQLNFSSSPQEELSSCK